MISYNNDEIKNFLKEHEDMWEELESKPELFQYNHYMNFLHIVDIDENIFKDNAEYSIYRPAYERLKDFLTLFAGNKKIGKSYFIMLNPQQFPIRQYEELEEYTSKIVRHYLPITVNKEDKFCIDDKIITPLDGQDFAVDPDGLYSIYNGGTEPSVYLVIDIIKD